MIIDFAAAKAEREPHSAGTRICLGCRHEWMGVSPIGADICLECPSCGLPKGVTKNLYGAEDGDLVLKCDCGCEALFVHRRQKDGMKYVRCMACGDDLTEAFFG